MENPFFINNYLRLEASINKLMLIGIENFTEEKNLEGKSAFQIFSTEQIVQEIKIHSQELELNVSNIPEKELPIYLNSCLNSQNTRIKETAVTITKKFGARLGIILYILKRGKTNSPFERNDWTSQDWDYWKTIENIVFTGGLASHKMGELFRESIYEVFKKTNTKPYNIFLTENSSSAGLSGASMYVKEESQANLIFDFGQSFLKRSIAIFDKKTLTQLKKLEKAESKYMEWTSPESSVSYEDIRLLSDYLQNIIINSYMESKKYGIHVGDEIIVSMANYIINGKILNRGGYGKLSFLDENIEVYLSKQLYEKTKRKFKIKIVHDGSAIAANFTAFPNVASISLGTAFGIGFPNKNLYFKEIGEDIKILKTKGV